jgi:probable F420-dependent oxidoreductase
MEPFRFGVVMHGIGGNKEWTDKCRAAERLGYDVILVPDHLGNPSPFPAMAAAAQATERPRVGPFVINTSFHNPTLLARDVATTDQLTGGRLELGLGAGHRKEEFAATGITWRPLAERIDRLEKTIDEMTKLFADEAYRPEPVTRPRPPLLIGGNSDRMLELAARHADILGLSSLVKAANPQGFRILDAETIDDRVAYFRAAVGDRPVELNMLVRDVVVTPDREAEARKWLQQAPYLDLDQFLASPTVLVGSVDEIAEQLHGWRSRFGFTYIVVHEPRMATFGPVIEALAGE